jgi:hypothetical protein
MPKKIEVIQPRADDIVEMAIPTKISYPRAITVETRPIRGYF